MPKNFSTKLSTILIGTLLVAVFFGAHMGMNMDEHGNMSNCIFMTGDSAVCPMDWSQHFQQWRQAFTSTMPSETILLALAIALFASLSILAIPQIIRNTAPPLAVCRARIRSAKLSNHLLQNLSDGRLSAKICNFSKNVR